MRVEEGTQATDEFNNNKFTCIKLHGKNQPRMDNPYFYKYVEIIMEYMKHFSNVMTYLIKKT